MATKKLRSKVSPAAITVPAGAPRWVTPELIEHTIRVWQQFYADQLISEDALAIIMGVSRIANVLSGEDCEAVRCPGTSEQP